MTHVQLCTVYTLYSTEVVQYYRGQITGVDMGWSSIV